MSLTFWVKKKFAPPKTHKGSNRRLLPRTSSASATTLEVPLIPGVVIAADLGWGKCQSGLPRCGVHGGTSSR
ncbi:unnamed protein product [Prunus armeniaca]|uniref:Uncharacterized protein n=1 Tax=Prunus armeniaca TaxID=36596 RepID=A0A6J5XI84_PRUAR|nr:unnamed protein product [Prunus armeniaca]CAB4311685.1 unnamed protein product [Prunus armeniaca]